MHTGGRSFTRCLCRLGPLPNHLPRIKLNKHGRVRFEIFDIHGEAEFVEEEELEFEMIQFGEGKPSDLFVTTSAVRHEGPRRREAHTFA